MATVRTADRTGIEMEALTAVSVGALALVDMVKAVDKHARITDVRVTAKSGGRSGDWTRVVTARRAVVICASTRAATGVYPDRTGPLIVAALREWGYDVDDATVVPDGDPCRRRSRRLSRRRRTWCSPPVAPGSPRPTRHRR